LVRNAIMPYKEKSLSSFFNSIYLRRTFLALEIILLLIIAILSLKAFYDNRAVVPYYTAKLDKKLDDEISSISKFLNEQQRYVDELSVDETILDYFQKIKDNQHINANQKNNFEVYIHKLQQNIGFKNLAFIGIDAVIRFSTHARLLGIDLHHESQAGTPLFRSFQVASLTLTEDFSDFLYSTLLMQPVFYLTAPIYKNEKLLGMLAFQIDDLKLNTITRDYLDLGQTGEIVLAVQTGPEIFFITPTRNDPSIRFTKRDLFAQSGFEAIVSAGKGNRSSGINLDYRGHKSLASWGYIPRVDWALVVKIDLQEIYAPIKLLRERLKFLGAIAIFFGIITLILYHAELYAAWSLINRKFLVRIPRKLHYTILTFFGLFLILSATTIFKFQGKLSSAVSKAQHLAEQQVEAGISSINRDLENIRQLSDFIALDLQAERLISADIELRLRREIIENEGLVRISIAYKPDPDSPKRGLYAPSMVEDGRGNIQKEMIEESYDYTDPKEVISKTLWYALPMLTGRPQWLNPSADPLTKDMVITYSRPFFYGSDRSSPSGVVAISYKLSRFAKIVADIGVGRSGYAFLLSQDGTFLYHPIHKNVVEKMTLLQFAQEEGNDSLQRISEKIRLEKPLLMEFTNPGAKFSSWIYSQPITINGWTLATVFSNQEIGLPMEKIKKNLFIIIIYLTLTIMFCSLLFAKMYIKNPILGFVNFSNLIMIATLLTLWFTINHTEHFDDRSQILITDESVVSKFIDWQTEEASRKKEPIPITIPCGIEIYSLEQTNPTRVSFSGHIWHKYHRVLHKDVIRTIRIPQAISYTILNQITTTEGDWDIVGLNVTATLYHEHDYTKYPFDQHNIIIPLEHAEISKNIMLIPDLEAYKTLEPAKLPGLDTSLSITSFHALDSFFNFTPHNPNTDFGIRQLMELSDQYRLAFNVRTQSDLLVPFIFFFLPLLVILISIFAVLMLEQRETSPYTMIGPFTGLFFALVLLHRSLHEKAPADHTLYIEYAFFYSYIVIILLVIHTILVQLLSKEVAYQNLMIPIYKMAFWPIQLTAWIITTVLVFY
jgi:hypothetical protein